MKKIQVFGPLLSIMIVLLATVIIASAAQGGKVYINPYTSDGNKSNMVEIRVDAINIQSGQFELLYDPSCIEVLDFTRNTPDFDMGSWDSSANGREWITFMNTEGTLTGDYLIGTLMLQCTNKKACTTVLNIDNDKSKLFNNMGNEVSVDWMNEAFDCGNREVELLEKETVYNNESTPFVSMVSISVIIILTLLIRRKNL